MSMFMGGQININGNQSHIAILKKIIEEGKDKDISEFKKNSEEFFLEEDDDTSFTIGYSTYENTRPEDHFKGLMVQLPDIEWIFSHGVDDAGTHSAMGNRFIVFKNGEKVFEDNEWYNASDFMDSNEDEDIDPDVLLEKITDARSEGEDAFYFACIKKLENGKK